MFSGMIETDIDIYVLIRKFVSGAVGGWRLKIETLPQPSLPHFLRNAMASRQGDHLNKRVLSKMARRHRDSEYKFPYRVITDRFLRP